MHLISLLIIPLNILFIVYVTSAVSGNQQNSCPKYNRFQKADGTYYQTLTHVCCPDYREVNDICIACDPGYYGQNCSHKCVSGNYGQGCKLTCQCNSQQTCHHMDGCVCKAGLMGPGCKQVCEEGRFGERCREHCQCSKYSECNHVTGDCKCDPGYDGRTCHDHCSYPKYGPKCDRNCYCPKHNSCHPVTGECACPAGFNGNDCTIKCPEGTFGVDCEGKCGCSSGSCDFRSGKCTCFPGYSGRFCNDECLDGFYGDQCQHPCNCTVDKLCHHVTGECHCLAGKSGPDCTENNEDSSTTGIVIGVVFALFIPTVTAVVLCYLYQRNYLKCLQDSKHNQAYDDDSIHYEDIEDYAEIPESKMIQNYPYSYADADSVAPPVKPREPTRTKATNPYLSLPDATRLSKLYAGSEEKSGRKTKDLSKDFTDLLRKNKCESHQGFDKDRIGSTVSVESISGYLKPSFQRKKSNKFHRRRANVMTNRNGYWEEDGKGENDERGSYIEISLDKKVDENDFENKHSNIAESS